MRQMRPPSGRRARFEGEYDEHEPVNVRGQLSSPSPGSKVCASRSGGRWEDLHAWQRGRRVRAKGKTKAFWFWGVRMRETV
jgi:hypothetical protein